MLCRYRVFQAINATSGADPTVDVHCSEKELGGRHEGFEGMLSNMEHSEFCLVLPGDSQSTRRLSEIFLAGAQLHGCRDWTGRLLQPCESASGAAC